MFGSQKFSEEELGYALKLLQKFDSVEDIWRFWKIAGHSMCPGPNIERIRPWDANLNHS